MATVQGAPGGRARRELSAPLPAAPIRPRPRWWRIIHASDVVCPEQHRLTRSVYIPESIFLECRTWLPRESRRCTRWSYIWRRPDSSKLVVEVSRGEAEQLTELRHPVLVLAQLELDGIPAIAEWVRPH